MVFSHCVPSLTVSVSVQVDATDSKVDFGGDQELQDRSDREDAKRKSLQFLPPPSYKLVYNPHEYSSCEF